MSTTTPRRGDVVTYGETERGTVTGMITEQGSPIVLVNVRRWSDGAMMLALPEHLHIVRRRRYSPAIDAMIDAWDGGDVWGSAMSMAWAVAEVSRAAYIAADDLDPVGELAEVEDVLQITWGAAQPIDLEAAARTGEDPDNAEVDFTTAILAAEFVNGDVTPADLSFAARVLHRYLRIAEAAGHSY